MAGPLRPLYPNRVACVSGELFRDRTSRSALPAPPSSPLFVWNLANKKTFRVGFFFFSTRLNEPPNSFALKQTQRRLNIKPASQRTDKQTNKQTNKHTNGRIYASLLRNWPFLSLICFMFQRKAAALVPQLKRDIRNLGRYLSRRQCHLT